MLPDSSSPAARRRRLLMALLLGGLVVSGVAGIINQVLWQRALKIYLAGSEAISAMIVVFVFMLGLGLGSRWAGHLAGRLRNPLRSLAAVELGLAAVNSAICVLLSLDLSESIYAFQRGASVGIPLRVLYSLTAILLLTGPCLLMGMTIPFATEGCQRQLDIRENRFLGNLFFLNTAGAVLGALLSGFLILPIIGQKAGLLLAVGLNSLAGICVVASLWRLRREAGHVRSSDPVAPSVRVAENGPLSVVGRPLPVPADRPETEDRAADHGQPTTGQTGLRPELLVGFGLGFLSLAYEMYLFRVASLVFGPFPYTFSLVLALFLLTWSLGVGVARFVPRWIPFWLIAAAISLAVVPRVYQVARAAPAVAHSDDFLQSLLSSKWALFGLCYVPCLLFGILFTHVVERFAKSWGADVGRYFAFNTFGSCAGILVGTLVGFEFAPEWTPWTAAVAMAAIPLATLRTWTVDPAATPSRQQHRFAWGALAVFLAVGSLELIHWNRNGRSMEQPEIEAAYYGRGGVILIDRELNLEWDGLWHSELRQGDNHVGTSNWRMAVIPFLCRNRDRCPDVCVIGLGTGITAGTLSRIRGVERIDVYEINEELKRVLADYPDGTMHVATDPRITIHWQDGRSGLALHDRKYDLITQQPLWLKQAGSSTLLSREYFELVKSRLKPDGVFCIYCNTADWMGTEEQARTVRQTARSVFPYGETFVEGYMLVVSRQPFRFDRRRIEARLANEPTLRRECEAFGIERLAGLFDANRLSWKSPYLVTDDHPIIEYPYITRMLVRRAER